MCGIRNRFPTGNFVPAGNAYGALLASYITVHDSAATRSVAPHCGTTLRVVLRQNRALSFRVGRVQYQHAYSLAGGAQYGLASSPPLDLLTIYAEAFERDANPEDFSLEAIIAHERGHQMLSRHPRLAALVGKTSLIGEEILASILGALISRENRDQESLRAKAVAELLARGEQPAVATRLISQLQQHLEKML